MVPFNRAQDCTNSFPIRLLRIMYREFFGNHLPMRAGALTFSIILSLVPILALSSSLLKGLGNDQQLKTGIVHLIDQWEPVSTSLGEKPPNGIEGTSPQSLPVLHQAVQFIFAYVDRTNFAALGIFGVFSLLVTTFFVFSSIENALNTIWHTTQRRSLHRILIDYLALLLLLPISFNLAFALEAIFTSDNITNRLSHYFPNTLVQLLLFHVVPFLFIVSTLTLLYLFAPQRRVYAWTALIGATVASLFWFLLQKIYFTLQLGVTNYNIIYGSFASVPLFLIWIYNGWVCILIGALLSYALQHHRSYQFTPQPLSFRKSVPLAFDILLSCYQNYENRRPTSNKTLQESYPSWSPKDIHDILGQLVQGGFVTRALISGRPTLVPCISANKLLASEVISFLLGDQGHIDQTYGETLTREWMAELLPTVNLPFSQLLRRNGYAPTAGPDHS